MTNQTSPKISKENVNFQDDSQNFPFTLNPFLNFNSQKIPQKTDSTPVFKYQQVSKTNIWIFFYYLMFLFKLIFKKKNTIIIPICLYLLSTAVIIATFVLTDARITYIISYSLIFVELIFTIIFSSIKAINIFIDLEDLGIDIIVFSKRITTQNVILAKVLFFLTINLLWAFNVFLFNLILILVNKNLSEQFNHYLIYSFFAILFCGWIFGLVTALIGSKFSSKVALTLPLLFFTPILIGGTFLNSLSTNSLNATARVLNLAYDKNSSETISDANIFYLNNNKDEIFITPKNYDNEEFNDLQKALFRDSFQDFENVAYSYQMYSWFLTPYQMMNVFDLQNENILEKISDNQESNLKNYLYYNRKESKDFSYQLNSHPELLQLEIQNNNFLEKAYLVPGVFKNQTIFNNAINTNIIYARENASNFDVSFDEDNYIFASPDNLVGSLKPEILKGALSSQPFNQFAASFFARFNEQTSKPELLNAISVEIDELGGNLVDGIIDENAELFKPNFDTNLIKNVTEKKIYLATALIYYLYFAQNDSGLLKNLLQNDDPNLAYTPQRFSLQISSNNYFIGGYSSYVPVQQVVDQKVVSRYTLNESNNYLFQPVKEAYSLGYKKTVVDKNQFIYIWIGLTILLLTLVYLVYLRKDYR
ncbi:ABC-2 type transport system permease protein [Mycoplasmoides fastidiosum]|uniref:ABC-2 type transport system permease protein n=1 Tax=Mycoplasmoides fastidiosum TaxID=92758 RepID=A0ABU0LZ01_9BACT|nr:ABC transporter permease [Mycoplasmoides fastidiosum]MDQ0513936.1 ABC-2 type transport system permease protein [Mycoplasmoides fastidiosum]UUD37650.1 ABC transporter permease [Mycoplasmoides fastidiosum]